MKVSVLMNKYNEDSIDSVLRQLYDVEMFVAETDKIEDRIEDARIKYCSVINLNDLSKFGDYILILESGDILTPNAFDVATHFDNEKVVAVSSCLREYKYRNLNRFASHNKDFKIKALYTSEILFRKSALQKLETRDIKDFTGLMNQLKALGEIKHVDVHHIAERHFAEELIEKWEQQRELRLRRSMKMSIIIAVKSRSKYVKRVIRSLLVQDLDRDLYDVIIVDCNSQDDLGEYIETIKAKNINHIVIPHLSRYDRALAYNVAAQQSKNQILVFSEADIIFPKDALRQIRDFIINNEKSYIVIPHKKLEKIDTCTVLNKTYSDYVTMAASAKVEEETRAIECFALEKQYYEEIGGFDEDYSGESYEKIDFVERLQKSGMKEYRTKDFSVLHMWHSDLPVEEEGYYYELYKRKKIVSEQGSQVRNLNQACGIIVQKRPKVLFVFEPEIWEPGSICKNIANFLQNHYNVEFCGARSKLRSSCTSQYDIVYSIDSRTVQDFKATSSRFATGIFDYVSWNDGVKHNVPRSEMLERLMMFRAMSVPCKELGNIFNEFCDNVYHTPVAVDTMMYKPLKEKRRVSKNFTVGWVGKIENKHTVEGFLEYVKPAVRSIPDVEIFTAMGGEDVNGYLQMLGFYNALDCLVFYHENSGECKTILEAMACGVPVITTNVSDVKDIITNGVDGIIIPRDEKELIANIETLKNKKEYRKRMGEEARKKVVQKWDWRMKICMWKDFFDFLMRQKR